MTGPLNAAETLLSLLMAEGREVVLQVKGFSMWPTIVPSEGVIVRRLTGPPSFGQVVLLRSGPEMIVHRVVGRGSGGRRLIYTKGDNCRNADSPVRKSEIVGAVIGIQKEKGFFIPWQLRAPYSWIIALLSRLEASGYRFVPYILRNTLWLSSRIQRKWYCFQTELKNSDEGGASHE